MLAFPPRLHLLLFLVPLLLLPPPVLRAQVVLPPDFSESLVLGGFTEPVGCTWDELGRAYVWEKAGLVWVIENGIRLPDPLIDLREEVGNWRDHGLLGFALAPDFQSSGNIFLMYVVDRHHLMHFGTPAYNPQVNEYLDATIVRITRYTAMPPSLVSVDPLSRFVLLGESPQTGPAILHESHGAGTLAFGTDGTLLASIGDGASYLSVDVGNAAETYHVQALADGIIRPQENVGAFRAQMVNSFNGKILRLDPVSGDGVPGNPWFDPAQPRSAASRSWAMGFRNAYRFTVRPGSGSADPAEGDPGALYIGDVGWNLWEELNVADAAGLNFGWPVFEGFDPVPYYMNVPVQNGDAPDPLFNGVDCTNQFLLFQDLIVQDTPVHLNAHPHPCDPTVQIPNSIPKHVHRRPAIDWRHGNQSRTGGFSGPQPVTYDLDDPASPVPGPRFGGFAAIGGPWMEGAQLPLGYQEASFHGDYAMGFIRRFMFNEHDEPVSVHNFASGLGAVTWIGAGPDGCIWYIRYTTNELRRICYDLVVDLPPIAVATQSVQYGPSPLAVSFTGSGSSDPGGGAVSHAWDFGDGGTSTEADPVHVFTAPDGVPTLHTVTLTVTDTAGQSASVQLIVSVNNSPPVVEITSFPDGSYYTVGEETLLPLQAEVNDAEHGPSELTYAWRTTLQHNTHSHPEPVDTQPVTSTVISGVGCDGETYSYVISLTVMDAAGLSTTVQHSLFPACHLIPPTAVINADPVIGFAPLQVQFDGSASYDPGAIVSYFWDLGDGTTATGPTPVKVFNSPGMHTVSLTVTDDDGLTGQAVRVIQVITLDPPQCVGSPGGILREQWNGITGSSLVSLISAPAFSGPPSSVTMLPEFNAPMNTALNYGARVRGYIIPEVSGSYIFTLTSDDASAAYLSPNADPVHKQLIASVPGFTLPMEFDKYPSQVSTPIDLQAGVYYYVEVLHKQGTSTDHLTLRWHQQGQEEPQVIPGTMLAPWEDCLPWLQTRMLLQGPWMEAEGLMRDDLRATGVLPMSEPYSALGYTVIMGAWAQLDPALLDVIGQNAVVDWLLIELRAAQDQSQVVSSTVALLQRDGDVMAANGFPRLLFDVPEGNYHLAVRHRNHLGAMTDQPVSISPGGALVDLSQISTATWGMEARKELPGGRAALWCGNVVPDGVLKYTGAFNDREPILDLVGGLVPTQILPGYHLADVDLNGLVRYTGWNNDRDPILRNIGGSQPTAVRMQQLP
jgi:PKD repeat protein